jgi:four helix bundle protein
MDGSIRHFKDLTTWQVSHQLVLSVYRATSTLPGIEKYGLISQMNRSALSITSNIAEGFGRESYKEKVHFYVTARGSLHELENQIILAHDLRYLPGAAHECITESVTSAHKLLNALIKKTKERVGVHSSSLNSKF